MKLIIFDLDGTLLDTLQDLGDSCNAILEQHGYPTHPLVAYKKFVGNGLYRIHGLTRELYRSFKN